MAVLQSLGLILLVILMPGGYSNSCRNMYVQQPPAMLDCDPMGKQLKLQCKTSNSLHLVTWYWTQNDSEAGFGGTEIRPNDNNQNYQVTNIAENNTLIAFTVNESTLGYYWCKINAGNVSLRPSIIMPVCLPMNYNCSQQNKCNASHISALHHHDTECAEENSTTVISRPPLPTFCAGSPTSKTILVCPGITSYTSPLPTAATTKPTTDTNTVNPTDASPDTTVATTVTPTVATTVTTATTSSVLPNSQQSFLVPAVVTIGVLVVVLMAVAVICIVVLSRKLQKGRFKHCKRVVIQVGKNSNSETVELAQQLSLKKSECFDSHVMATECSKLDRLSSRKYSAAASTRGTGLSSSDHTMADDMYSTITMSYKESQKPPKESQPQSVGGTRYVNTTPHQNNGGMKPFHQSKINSVELDFTERKEETNKKTSPQSLSHVALDNPNCFESKAPATKDIQDLRTVEYKSLHCFGIEKEEYSCSVTPIRLESQTDYLEENTETCPYLTPVSVKGCVRFSHDLAQKRYEELDKKMEILYTAPHWKKEETKPSPVVTNDEQKLLERLKE